MRRGTPLSLVSPALMKSVLKNTYEREGPQDFGDSHGLPIQ